MTSKVLLSLSSLPISLSMSLLVILEAVTTGENEQELMLGSLPVVAASKITKRDMDRDIGSDDSDRRTFEVIKNCYHSNVMNLCIILKNDGSISFLRNSQNDSEKTISIRIRNSTLYNNSQCYQLCSRKLNPVLLLKLETAYRKEAGTYKKQDSHQISWNIADSIDFCCIK